MAMWMVRVPINAMTRSNLLGAKCIDLYGEETKGGDMEREMEAMSRKQQQREWTELEIEQTEQQPGDGGGGGDEEEEEEEEYEDEFEELDDGPRADYNPFDD